MALMSADEILEALDPEQREVATALHAVSYTHLTLPTNREV